VAEDFPAGLADPGSPVPGGPAQIASYQMVEEIGRGGMAVVYRARDVRLGRWVALKVLAEDLARDDAFRRRFIRESRAAATVDHPNIIPIFDAGEAAGVLFIAMRYVAGQDVHSLLNRAGPLPAARAAGLVAQVASALDAAHACGLVHRDVKPANMLLGGLAEDGSEDHVYLSDFGISKTSQSTTNLTLTGQVLGTLNYLAPEQIEGRTVDGRADAYSLACAAFEMLAGAPPFRRDQSLAVMWAQLSAPPPPLTSARPDLPAAVDQVMFRGLAKAPEERYPSCRAFAAALQEACGVSSAELPPHAAQAVAAQAVAGPGLAGSGLGAPGRAAADPAGPAAGGRGETTPVSPAAGFPAPPRAAPPTSADLPYRAPQASAGPPSPAAPPSAEPSYLSPPASAGRAYVSPPASAGPSYVIPPASADWAYTPPPASAGPSYVTPPAGAGQPAAWPAGQPPQRPGPPGPYRPQPPRKRRRGLAVVAVGVAVLAVIAAGLAFLKYHHAQPGSGASTVASSPPAGGGTVSAAASPPLVVKRYYAAISRRAYGRAWKLGGDNTKTSYPQFVAGYRGTRRDEVTILTWTGDQVTAKISAFQANGAVKQYQGTYLVRSGVITSFNVRQVS
jgi:serine/threonine protein kinase